MKIFVTAKPNAKRIGVRKVDDTHFVVSVQEPPREGRANYAITNALAEYFGVPATHICLISGGASRQKVFEIPQSVPAQKLDTPKDSGRLIE